MNKRNTFSATYTPDASGVWWKVYRNGVYVTEGSAPTRRVAERDVSDAIAVAQGHAFANPNHTETRSAS